VRCDGEAVKKPQWGFLSDERREPQQAAGGGGTHKKPALVSESGFLLRSLFRESFSTNALGRPGSDLLSQGLSHSTISAEEFNGRVRDGIGFYLFAKTTRPAKRVCVFRRRPSPLALRRDYGVT
jgi:hypothetical protein